MSKAGWRLSYMGRLMTTHGATLSDAQEHFRDVKKIYGIDYEDDPQRVADEEAKLFGFPWNDWIPEKDDPLPSCHTVPPTKAQLRSDSRQGKRKATQFLTP